jgi:hypothetical protein
MLKFTLSDGQPIWITPTRSSPLSLDPGDMGASPKANIYVNIDLCVSGRSCHHDIGDVMPKWNLSTPYMITVMAVVMTIVVVVITLYSPP